MKEPKSARKSLYNYTHTHTYKYIYMCAANSHVYTDTMCVEHIGYVD